MGLVARGIASAVALPEMGGRDPRMAWFPKDENFFELFKRQGELVCEGCGQLHEMMEKFDDLDNRARKLKAVEHLADQVTHDIFERLNRTFVTPLDREDIYNLASGLDDVLDSAEAIGSRLVL